MLFRMGRGCRTRELKVAVVTSMICPRSNQGNNSSMDEGGATEAPPLAEELLTFYGCCRRDSLFCEREVATGRLRTSQQISPQDVHLDSAKWSQQVIKINKRYLKPGGRCGVAPRGPLEGAERAYDQNTQHTSVQVSKSQLKNYLRNKFRDWGGAQEPGTCTANAQVWLGSSLSTVNTNKNQPRLSREVLSGMGGSCLQF